MQYIMLLPFQRLNTVRILLPHRIADSEPVFVFPCQVDTGKNADPVSLDGS